MDGVLMTKGLNRTQQLDLDPEKQEILWKLMMLLTNSWNVVWNKTWCEYNWNDQVVHLWSLNLSVLSSSKLSSDLCSLNCFSLQSLSHYRVLYSEQKMKEGKKEETKPLHKKFIADSNLEDSLSQHEKNTVEF